VSINWGPHFVVPTRVLNKYFSFVVLREIFDETMLKKELAELGLSGSPVRITSPWYFRKKGSETWIKIGESSDKARDFAVRWGTTKLQDGEYEILGIVNVAVKSGSKKITVARQKIVNVAVEN
jgi:hypothetical protein